MSIELITLLLVSSMLLLLVTGLPLSFALGGTAMVFAYLFWGKDALYLVATTVSSLQLGMVLIALPMFIFMGVVLERSGIANDLFDMMYQWGGSLKGGLAIGVVLICTIFAAMSGVSAAATITMGVIALPAMLERNYDKSIAMGPILAGGALGILIPPSIVFIVFGFLAQVSVGQLFMGGVIPGLILSLFFCIYIAVRSQLQPSLAPAVPLEERVSWRRKFVLLRGLILPFILIVMVLGSIFLGVASPTEAAAVGAFGSLTCAAVKGNLNWKVIFGAGMLTLKVTTMILWIMIGAKSFGITYIGLGGQQLMSRVVASIANPMMVIIGMQLSFFVLGMLMDAFGIMMITLPIYIPLVLELGFNPIWFGVLFTVNMEMATLTPPFGANLFYLKGVVPEGITMLDIYRSILPFVILQAIGLALVMIYPQLALWLPSLMIK